MDQTLMDVLSNDDQLTESNMKQLIEENSADNKTSELLSTLCNLIPKVHNQWYTLYKLTVFIKYLFGQHPEEYAYLLLEQMSSLKSLKDYTYIDSYGSDKGANIRINVHQLLDFIEENNTFHLDSKAEQLLVTLNSIESINSEKILEKLRADVSRFNRYLPGPITYEKYIGLDQNPNIDGNLYGKLVEKVVESFDDNFPIIDGKIDSTIERFIVSDGATFSMFYESLFVLTDALKRSTDDKITNSIIAVLEKLIKSEALFSAITDICKPDKNSAIEREEMNSKWQSFLQIIVSLPNRIANKLGGKVSDCFLPDTFAKIISVHIVRSMTFLNSCRKKFAIVPNEKMLSMLISKVVITLGAHRLDALIDIMSEWCSENDENIRDFIKNTLSHIDRPAMEPIAVLFLKRSEPNLGIDRIFENFLTNPYWKHVFVTKIPLMSYYESDNLMRNLIAYLSTNDERLLPDLVIRLLDIWGDRSALNHTSFEQHEYISKLILMSLRKLKGTLTKQEKDTMKRLLFAGTSAHLESTQSELRAIGMIVGEVVIELLSDSDDEPKLKYDYDGMPEKAREIVDKIRDLGNVEKKPENSFEKERNLSVGKIVFKNVGERKSYELGIECGILPEIPIETCTFSSISNDVKLETKVSDSPRPIVQGKSQDDEDLDSDDDLVPYDMSNDTAISEKLRPTYLRDLMENLLNSQSNSDPNIFAESMSASEELILSQLPKDDSTFAIELLEILVTLRNQVYVENFKLLKFNACVAIAFVRPKEAAKYLCNEFHSKIGTYSIQDRLFILDVLGESARRLSKIETKPEVDDKTSRNRVKKSTGKRITLAIDTSDRRRHETLYDDDFEVLPNCNEATIDWEEIVSKRIESNTRRFAHTAKPPRTTMNKFNDVASSFFYPLLYGFRREGSCMYNTPKTFEDQENILLVNYLKTLSIIMIAAENCVIVPKMAKEIMDLAWSLRYHQQAKVRLCVIENTASVVITLPKESLTGELMELIYEFRAWLVDVSDNGIRGDPDSDCRNLGKNVVALIDSIFTTTLNEL